MAKTIPQQHAEIQQWIEVQSELMPEEKLVLLACLAQIKTASDFENKRLFDLSAIEFAAKLSASELPVYYQTMKEGADELFGRNIFVAKTIRLASGEKSDRNMRGISFFRCYDQEYKLELSFLVGFSDYINQLKQEFS